MVAVSTLPVESRASGGGCVFAHAHTDENGAALVRSLSVEGSNQLRVIARANALVMLPQTPGHLQAGSTLEVSAFP